MNYSCAYDAVFTPMYNVWQDHGPKWTEWFEGMNEYAAELARGFQEYKLKTGTLENACDAVRKMLHVASPVLFPVGPTLTGLDDLTQYIFGTKTWGTEYAKCTRCDEIWLTNNHI